MLLRARMCSTTRHQPGVGRIQGGAMRKANARLGAFGLTMALVLANAGAANAASDWNVGIGATSCGEWLTARASPPDDPGYFLATAYLGWVQGYLVGANFANSKDFPAPPNGAAIAPWLDNHCRAHPLDDLFQSANGLALDLVRRARGLPEKG